MTLSSKEQARGHRFSNGTLSHSRWPYQKEIGGPHPKLLVLGCLVTLVNFRFSNRDGQLEESATCGI